LLVCATAVDAASAKDAQRARRRAVSLGFIGFVGCRLSPVQGNKFFITINPYQLPSANSCAILTDAPNQSAVTLRDPS
jgi:hypothetical protein